MKKMFTRFLFLSTAVLFATGACAQFPTIYASISSGSWGATAPYIWETFTGNATNTPGAQGTGTAAATVPSGTHFIYIRSSHVVTMGSSNRSCFGMTIEAGGRLWAAEGAARRLQLVNGGTGFLYPQTGTITNDGVMGGFGDGLFFENGTNCQSATITGTGFTYIRRIRMPGGIAGGVVNIIIDQNMTMDTTNNYALSAAYSNTATTDNYSVTINAGRTLTIAGASTYFHTNPAVATAGIYTYNINGTLDLSASTQTSANLTAISPTSGTINLNINGGLVTGAAFNSSPVAPGVANINVASGVIVDATLATVMNFNGNAFILNGTGALKRTVPNTGAKTVFPITTTAGGYNAVTISGNTGAAEVFTVSLKNTFTNPPPANTISREWNIVETTPAGNIDTVRLAWTTADESGSGFSHAGGISIIRWTGTEWEYTPADVTGTGTLADPYIAKASSSATAFSLFGFFAVTSFTPSPVSFVNVSVAQRSSGIQVNFANATELDVLGYVIERSTDGRNFTAATTLSAKTNNGLLNSYTYTDNTVAGANVFYRIKATESNGHVNYSAIVKVNINGIKQGVSVYPNPVKDNNVSVQLENLDKANYTLSLINNFGQTVYTKQINHLGGSATMVIELPASTSRGVYNLQITDGSFRDVKNIVIE